MLRRQPVAQQQLHQHVLGDVSNEDDGGDIIDSGEDDSKGEDDEGEHSSDDEVDEVEANCEPDRRTHSSRGITGPPATRTKTIAVKPSFSRRKGPSSRSLATAVAPVRAPARRPRPVQPPSKKQATGYTKEDEEDIVSSRIHLHSSFCLLTITPNHHRSDPVPR